MSRALHAMHTHTKGTPHALSAMRMHKKSLACRTQVRRLLGPNRILGVTVKSVEEAVRAKHDGADYLGAGAGVSAAANCVNPTLPCLGCVLGVDRSLPPPWRMHAVSNQ